MDAMACDMSTVVFEVDSFMLDRYMHEYHSSFIFGIEPPSLSSSILDALYGKVGLYLRNLVCGLRLPPSSFFLEVLCFYKVNLVLLCPNLVSSLFTFEAFCVSLHIPISVILFHYFYHLKRYSD